MWTNFVIQRVFGVRGERLRDFFDDLDLEHVIPKLLQYINEAGRCGNVIWVLAEEFRRQHEPDNGTSDHVSDQQMNRHLRLQSLKEIGEEEAQKVLTCFAADLSMSTSLEVKGKTHLIWPVLHFKDNTPLAYIVMADVQTPRLAVLQSRVDQDIQYMAKHIGFSIQHWNTQKMSFLDDLTGLYNQKYLSLVLESEIYRSQRLDRKFSVLFMDVDYFKSVNDTRGHWVGSRLLVEIGRALKHNLRKGDYAFRYGGDEFVVVLPMTSAEGAIVAAERIRRVIETTDFIIDGEHLRLTFSIGLATFPDHAKTHKDIIKMADEAMYCGKNKSRNIVFVAS